MDYYLKINFLVEYIYSFFQIEFFIIILICKFISVSGMRNIPVKVFLPDGNKQKAIAFGFRARFSELQDAVAEETIEGRNIRIYQVKEDTKVFTFHMKIY